VKPLSPDPTPAELAAFVTEAAAKNAAYTVERQVWRLQVPIIPAGNETRTRES
jgi:hypothetical protein